VADNTGFACAYGTMWPDGFNRLPSHIEERAAFALASPDSVEQQAEGAASELDIPIRRHAAASFGPADEFCAAWRFVDLPPQNQGTAS
jgi:hypothetical protein